MRYLLVPALAAAPRSRFASAALSALLRSPSRAYGFAATLGSAPAALSLVVRHLRTSPLRARQLLEATIRVHPGSCGELLRASTSHPQDVQAVLAAAFAAALVKGARLSPLPPSEVLGVRNARSVHPDLACVSVFLLPSEALAEMFEKRAFYPGPYREEIANLVLLASAMPDHDDAHGAVSRRSFQTLASRWVQDPASRAMLPGTAAAEALVLAMADAGLVLRPFPPAVAISPSPPSPHHLSVRDIHLEHALVELLLVSVPCAGACVGSDPVSRKTLADVFRVAADGAGSRADILAAISAAHAVLCHLPGSAREPLAGTMGS